MVRRSIISFVCVLILSFVSTFLYALWVLGTPSVLLTRQEASLSRLGEGARIVRRFVFPDGVSGGTAAGPILRDWIGLSSVEFAEINPNWRVLSFSAEEVVVEEFCEETPQGGFVRLERDRVYVYDGRLEGCYRLRGPLDVAAHELNPQVIGELVQGLPFASDMDLALLLEGVRAP